MADDNTRRFNIYAQIHKGIRADMAETLVDVGRADWRDAADASRASAALQELLGFCEDHVRHENDFVHPAMERSQAGSSRKVVDDHIGHLQAIADLRSQLGAVENADNATRDAVAAQLYASLTTFIAENFEHMNYEETHNNAVLWSAYSDAELLALEDRLVASLTPAETMQAMRWMLPNSSHAERVTLLTGMRQKAPKPVFDAMIEMLHPLLTVEDWHKLERDLGLNTPTAEVA